MTLTIHFGPWFWYSLIFIGGMITGGVLMLFIMSGLYSRALGRAFGW